MGNAAELHRMTLEEFLKWDRTQTIRHELVDGEVYAMAGAGRAHNTMAQNLAFALRQHLKGTPCRVFMMDVKMLVESLGNLFYPDVMLTCSARDAVDPYIVREPKLLVEVLSPSTERFDRGDKFRRYRQLPTLAEYVLVDLEERVVELFRKGNDGGWALHTFDETAGVVLASVELTIDGVTLWADVPMLERTPPPPERGSA